jgi:hypothetical protein
MGTDEADSHLDQGCELGQEVDAHPQRGEAGSLALIQEADLRVAFATA